MNQVNRQTPVAFTIAGSDPSGGAGVQADLKTFSVIGVYGAAAITALTIQNTRGVSACHNLSPDIVQQQVSSVLEDMHVTHIKIGMTGNSEISGAIADVLIDFPGEVIYDPVRISSSGADLMTGQGAQQSWEKLISRATVLTPNRDELELLANRQIRTHEEGLGAAIEVMKTFPRIRVLCLTGGHFKQADTITDFMIRRKPNDDNSSASPYVTKIQHDMIKTKNLHGTGCTFAAAFAAFHLLSGEDTTAFSNTSDFVHDIIQGSANKTIGHGSGPLVHHVWRSKKEKET